MTDNHNYTTPTLGQTDWHVPLNENFEKLDTDIEIRDASTARSNYEPKNGAKFFATDTEDVYLGDGRQWQQVASRGKNPAFDSVSTDTINNIESVSPSVGAEGIQNALDTLAARGGGILALEQGTFSMDRDLNVHSNTVIKGAGMGSTVVKATTPAQWKTNESDLRNLVLQDFTFDGQNQGGTTRMFFSGNPENCHAERVEVVNAGERNGTSTAGGLIFRNGIGCSFYGCRVRNTSYVSLSMQKNEGKNRILNCVVESPNTSGDWGPHPISIESNDLSVVMGCVVNGAGAGDPCLNLNATSNCIAVGNMVTGGKKGINIANGGTHQRTIVGNNSVTNMSQFGILVQNTSTSTPPCENLLTGNIVKDIYGSGVKLRNNGHANITNNEIIDACKSGKSKHRALQAGAGERPPMISGNVIRNSGSDSMVVGFDTSKFPDGYAHVTDNRIVQSSGRAIEANAPSFVQGNSATEHSGAIVIRAHPSVVVNNLGSIKLIGTSGTDTHVRYNHLLAELSFKDTQASEHQITDNTGYTTENSGSASVSDGDRINHGLDEPPTYVNLTSSESGHVVSASAVDSSAITVKIIDSSGSTVGTDETVYWEAKAR